MQIADDFSFAVVDRPSRIDAARANVDAGRYGLDAYSSARQRDALDWLLADLNVPPLPAPLAEATADEACERELTYRLNFDDGMYGGDEA